MQRLRSHHSRPFHQLLMGKNSWNRQPWKAADQYDYGNAGGWSYWPGSWKAAQASQKGGKGGAPPHGHGNAIKENKFPSYQDVMVPAGTAETEVEAPVDAMQVDQSGEHGKQGYLKDLQKLLNLNRRLDGKHRKLMEEQKRRSAQWDQYQMELKEAYFSQLHKFESDMEKLDGEVDDVKKQRADAMERLGRLAEHGEEAPAKVEMDKHQPTTKDHAAWESLLGGSRQQGA